jgi:hypothetical protein
MAGQYKGLLQAQEVHMAIIDTKGKGGGGSGGDFKLLETDVYRAKIMAATLEEDQFADANRDGNKPVKLVLRWEVTQAGEEQEEDCVGCAVWQRFNPFYGTVREGGPSKFMAFIDALREQGYLEGFDPAIFDTDILEGIEQRVSVEKYTKTMGANAGKPGNKIVGVLPLRRAKGVKAPKNAPEPVAAGAVEDDGLPF